MSNPTVTPELPATVKIGKAGVESAARLKAARLAIKNATAIEDAEKAFLASILQPGQTGIFNNVPVVTVGHNAGAERINVGKARVALGDVIEPLIEKSPYNTYKVL